MNLYVSNLSFHTMDNDLKQMFEQFGSVSSAKVIIDRTTGRSRGFGFVEMDNTEEGNAAIKSVNLEAVIFSLSIGLLIGNLFRLPAWFRSVVLASPISSRAVTPETVMSK